ncbi:MAG: tetratricopeptide repeat protein, partial [Cyanobacteriota bacterium]
MATPWYHVQCATRSGVAEAFSDDKINVSWAPTSDQRPASETINANLKAGRYEEAIPLLEATLQLQPHDVENLTQLGMVNSDLGELVEARQPPRPPGAPRQRPPDLRQPLPRRPPPAPPPPQPRAHHCPPGRLPPLCRG